MRLRIPLPVLLAAALFCSANSPAAAAETNNAVLSDLKDLIARINDKIGQNKTNEADLAADIKGFDELLLKHKQAANEDRAGILFMKAQLYLQVFSDPEKALALFKQFKQDFPDSQISGNTDDVIRNLQRMIEMKNIQRKLAVGAKFPAFEEKDTAGKPLSLSDYKGKVVLIDFWATWCVPCLLALPDLMQVYGKYHDQGFEIVGISLDEDAQKLARFIENRNMPWRQHNDGKGWEAKLVVQYGVEAIPATYLLDRNGTILGRNLKGEDLDQAIAKALKEK